MRVQLFALTFITLLTACAPQSRTAGVKGAPRCFWNSQVTGFSDAGPGRAIVNNGSRDSWEVELSPGCPNVDWAQRIAILSRSGGRICSGANVELAIPDASGTGSRRCLVRSIRKLSAAEAAAVRGQAPRP